MISAILRHCQFDNCKIALIAPTNVDFQISNISKLRKLAKYSAILWYSQFDNCKIALIAPTNVGFQISKTFQNCAN